MAVWSNYMLETDKMLGNNNLFLEFILFISFVQRIVLYFL